MINEKLLQTFIDHHPQTTKGAALLFGQYAQRFGLQSIGDVYDTKAEFKRRYPGAITKARKSQGYPSVESLYKSAYADRVQKSYIPKILLFDIETAPMLAYVWKRWKENISLDQTVSEWFMICWSAKWLYSSEIMGDVLTSEEALAQDDTRIVKSLWELFNEADIVIAFNGLAFDVPKANTRFLAAGLNPPAPYHIVDPMKTLKKKFGFSSNKLDNLAMFFGIDTKLHTDFDLWKRCMQGDPEALSYMMEYNLKDTDILEEVFIKMLPWISNMPNISNIVEKDVCPFCGCEEPGIELDKLYYTGVNSYKLYRCPECGAIHRSRLPVKGFKPRASTVIDHR